MAKQPAAGQTKTRLTPALTGEQAAELYECFLHDTISTLAQREDCTLLIAVTSPQAGDYFGSLAPDVGQVTQVGATLGERLDAVLTECLANGFHQAFAMGSDSPDLPADHLTQAFTLLDQPTTDLVFGPTEDGGYYLIGCKQRWSPVVTEVTMSTPHVLRDTQQIADRVGARVALATQWYDVDEIEDVHRLRQSIGPDATTATASFLRQL